MKSEAEKRAYRRALVKIYGPDSQPRKVRVRREGFSPRYRMATQRARHPWAIDENAYLLLSMQPCDYCGGDTGSGIGLDRLDRAIGYLLSNVVPCCGSCNLIRSSRLTSAEMRVAMAAVVSFRTDLSAKSHPL